MFTSILVPLDGSEFAEAALPFGLDLARRTRGVVHLVRVHQSLGLSNAEPPIVIDPAWTEAVRADEAAYLERTRAQVAASQEEALETRLLDGQPADALVEYVRKAKIDLIVMATHGRGGISRFWLGSVADALVRRASAPVLLVRPPKDGGKTAEAAAIGNVLVPLDGSATALGVLPVAEAFARVMGARLTLLQVVRTMVGTGIGGLVPLPELAAKQRKLAQTELGALVTRLKADGFEASHVVMESPDIAPAILDYAERSGVDAVALATHGRSGFQRLTVGSVADKVMRGVEVPVLIVRPSQ